MVKQELVKLYFGDFAFYQHRAVAGQQHERVGERLPTFNTQLFVIGHQIQILPKNNDLTLLNQPYCAKICAMRSSSLFKDLLLEMASPKGV